MGKKCKQIKGKHLKNRRVTHNTAVKLSWTEHAHWTAEQRCLEERGGKR